MPLLATLLWITLISLVAVLSAWYARREGRSDAILALYVCLTLLSNLFAAKVIAFDLGIATFFAPGAVLIFSITFLLTDIVNERFGRRETLRMIGFGFASQLLLIALSYLVLIAPSAPFFMNQAAFETVFSVAPRIALAGLLAYLVSEILDAYVFAWLKEKTQGKQLWLRSALSTLPAMAIDSVVFVSLAFWGAMPILPLITGLVVMKWLVGIVDIPFMYLARAVLGPGK